MTRPKREWKVGDVVNVYGFDPNDAGKVLQRTIVDIECDGTMKTDLDEWVHPKQCRRLKPRKRREVWMNPQDAGGDVFRHSPGVFYTGFTETDYGMNGWIKFIEAPSGRRR